MNSPVMDDRSEHIIVCGMGQCGFRVACLLRRLGRQVTAISLATREDWIRQAEAEGVRVLVGDARDAHLLDQAGIAAARGLIAATDQDPVNIEIAIHASRVRPDLPIVMRIFDQPLAARLESALHVQRALSMSALAAPRFAAAILGDQLLGAFEHDSTRFWIGQIPIRTASNLVDRLICDLEVDRGVVPLLLVREGRVGVLDPSETVRAGDELVVTAPVAAWRDFRRSEGPTSTDPIAPRSRARRGASLMNALRVVGQVWRGTSQPIRLVFLALNVLIFLSVFVFQSAMNLTFVDALYFIVTTVTTTGYGDITPRDSPDLLKLYAALVMILGSATLATLYSLITDFIVTARFRELLGRQSVVRSGHVVVVGLGNLGYRILGMLRDADVAVVAVERDPSGELVGAVKNRGDIVFGDARSADVLDRAGVARASAVAAVTGDDAVNLGVSLAAREISGQIRTLARLFDADLARQTQGALSINAVLSASALAAPTFAASCLYSGVRAGVDLGNRLLIVHEAVMPPAWAGLTPFEVMKMTGAVIVARADGPRGSTFVEDGNRPVQAGTAVLLAESLDLAPDAR